MTDHVVVQHSGAVMHLQLNRADKKNALTHAMYAAMNEAIRAAEEDLSVGAIVLSGVEGCFTAGNDLFDFQQNPITDESAPVVQFLFALAQSTVPLLAAVDGPAVGIGSTLLLHCDYVLAAKSAKLHFPFVNLALPPEGGSTYLLSKQLGHARAAELLMLGETFDGEKAAELGIANECCEADALMERIMMVAEKFAAKPPRAIRKAKKLLKADQEEVIRQIRLEMKEFVESLSSPECHEALAAFLQKREPDFNQFRG